jgi:hypothetical protein
MVKFGSKILHSQQPFQWLMPVRLRLGGSWLEANQENSWQDPISKITRAKWTEVWLKQ